MDIYNWMMDIHILIMDIHSRVMDICNWIRNINNKLVYLFLTFHSLQKLSHLFGALSLLIYLHSSNQKPAYRPEKTAMILRTAYIYIYIHVYWGYSFHLLLHWRLTVDLTWNPALAQHRQLAFVPIPILVPCSCHPQLFTGVSSSSIYSVTWWSEHRQRDNKHLNTNFVILDIFSPLGALHLSNRQLSACDRKLSIWQLVTLAQPVTKIS